MNKYLLSLLIILINILLMSCPLEAQTFCMTPSSTDVTNARRMLQMWERSDRSINQNYPLRVYFHVIRKPDGTGGQSYSNVNQAFQILNNDFNPHQIFYVWNDSIDFINDFHYDYPSDSIFNINSHSNGIDIYLYPDEISVDGGGLANGVGVSSEYYVAGKYRKDPFPSLITSHIVSHEMGHVLFLWHTHHGTDIYFESDSTTCAELVNGSNSDICGDYITDTPADPGIYSNVDPITYQYLGVGVDENGDQYQPDTRQIMSYTDIRCMTYFSSEQGERMRNAIEALPYLQAASVSIHGPSVPTSSSVYYLENLPSNYSVTWAWKNSSTIPIASNTPCANSCTISNNNKAYINNSLVATIQKTGSTVATVEKLIDSGVNFSGTYAQNALPSPYNVPAIPATTFRSGDCLQLNMGSKIVLKSPYFINANISISGITPFSWSHRYDSITVRYLYPLPLLSNNGSTSMRPSLESTVFTGSCPGTYDVFQFSIVPMIPQIPINYSLDCTRSGSIYTFCFPPLSEMRDPEDYTSVWHITIAHVQTGKVVCNQDVRSSSISIDSSDWEPGIYSVQARNGFTELNHKIMIPTK